jgi:predicted phage replisome organizer
MAARDKERYFWLKLHRNFFKRHDIRILENMPNGKELVLFYLKLMTESVDHEGRLRFSDALPYSEEMLASVTDTETETVRTAMQIFREFKLLEVQEDGTIFLPAAARLLDSETYAARRKREAKEPGGGSFPPFRGNFALEKDIDTEIDTDTETETDQERDGLPAQSSADCRTQDVRRIVQAWNSLGLQQLSRVTTESRRGNMLRSRIAEYGTDAVLEAIEKIRNSDFLKGQNAKGWVITFEWFVKPNNFPKVLEGNYDTFYRATSEPVTKNGFLELMMEGPDEHP